MMYWESVAPHEIMGILSFIVPSVNDDFVFPIAAIYKNIDSMCQR